MVQLLRTQSNNPETRTFLRRSVCGYVGTTPLVCCPLQRSLPVPAATTTEQPQVTTAASSSREDRFATLLEPPDCGFGNHTVGRVVGGIPAKLGMF